MKKGKLYVFEGPDGVGKTTLSKWFADTLKNKYSQPVIWASFPGREKDTLGNLVYQLHHEPTRYGIASIDALSMQLLHIAAHLDEIKKRLTAISSKTDSSQSHRGHGE